MEHARTAALTSPIVILPVTPNKYFKIDSSFYKFKYSNYGKFVIVGLDKFVIADFVDWESFVESKMKVASAASKYFSLLNMLKT